MQLVGNLHLFWFEKLHYKPETLPSLYILKNCCNFHYSSEKVHSHGMCTTLLFKERVGPPTSSSLQDDHEVPRLINFICFVWQRLTLKRSLIFTWFWERFLNVSPISS